MRGTALLLGALALAGCAAHGPGMLVEEGYQRGALGVAAIERGDEATAEMQLNELRGVKADDPARLINLGKVYADTGRVDEALRVWRLALASANPVEVVTAGGRVVSTQRLAREALARYEPAMETAAR